MSPGYVYDRETGLYYVSSRYYDPEIGRWISIDLLLSDYPNMLSYNLYAYCGNNPVNNIDTLGTCYYNANGDWRHDNWEYLGGYKRLPDPQAVDLTEKLTEFMEENVVELEEYIDQHGAAEATLYFIKNVNDGGELDIKLQAEWAFKEGQMYIFNGRELRYDDPGNINFGYVGAVLFPEETLCFGAGVNQITKYGFLFGDLSTWFDDPRDNYMIRVGYALYVRRGDT